MECSNLEKRYNRFERVKDSKEFRVASNLRNRLWECMRRYQADTNCSVTERVKRIMGCDVDALVAHIENQFADGMNWDNYGIDGWHIDHIIPCAAYGALLMDIEWQKKCFNWRNLRPLWGLDNSVKHDKVDAELIKKRCIEDLLPPGILMKAR